MDNSRYLTLISVKSSCENLLEKCSSLNLNNETIINNLNAAKEEFSNGACILNGKNLDNGRVDYSINAINNSYNKISSLKSILNTYIFVLDTEIKKISEDIKGAK